MNKKNNRLFTIIRNVLLIHILTLTTIILLIWWLLSKWAPSKSLHTMNITWSTSTFQYDGNQHELTVSGYPTGATVTYTGGEDGANGATNVGSYTINAEITAAGYNKWEGHETLSITTAPMPTITWSTPDSFSYDGSSHTISVSGYPTGSTVTYTGGEDGANGATNVGTYTIGVSITNPNYQPYTGTHTLTITSVPFTAISIDTKTSNIVYGYSSTSWTQRVYISPTPDSFTYSFDSIDPALNGKLSIDSSSTTSDVKLNLTTGLVVGQYSYTIKCVAVKTGYTNGVASTPCTINITAAPMPTITWSTPDTFTYNGSSHNITVSGYPTGSTVTYTGGEDGGNGSTSAGSYTINATIANPNYQTWTGTHTLTINVAPFPVTPTWSTDTFIYDGNSHTISITNAPTSSTVTYTGGEDGANGATTVGTYTITATITLNNYQTWTGSHTLTINYSNYILLQNGTIYSIDVSYNNFLTNRTTSGTFDFTDLFGTSQTITKTDIKEIHLTDLPQITTAPDNYLKNMCSGLTNLTVADIQIPNTIVSVGAGFCQNMFSSCSQLSSLPSGFNLPQNLTGANEWYFCQGMFYGCSSLTSLPQGFNIPQGITGNAGSYFCYWMFKNCPQLTSLPSGFTLPQGITSTGTGFCYSMFDGCTSLTSLPANFNLPNGITSVNNNFCQQMFSGCSGLRNDSTNLVTITIPNPSSAGTSFCNNMFDGCSSLTGVPATPTAGSTVKINRG